MDGKFVVEYHEGWEEPYWVLRNGELYNCFDNRLDAEVFAWHSNGNTKPYPQAIGR